MTKKPEKPRCGAKSKRSGKPCRGQAMANGRCRMHGGVTGGGAPKGNSNAATHGFYARGLRPDEKPLWDKLVVGSLDDELKIARLQLRRVLEAQRLAEESPEDEQLLELSETSEKVEAILLDGAGEAEKMALPAEKVETTRTRTKPDYRAHVLRLTRLIGELEQRRRILAATGEGKIAAVAFIIEG